MSVDAAFVFPVPQSGNEDLGEAREKLLNTLMLNEGFSNLIMKRNLFTPLRPTGRQASSDNEELPHHSHRLPIPQSEVSARRTGDGTLEASEEHHEDGHRSVSPTQLYSSLVR